jgi:uncharacterized membrane protein
MKTIVGLFESREDAESAIRRLQTRGIPRDKIGIAMKDAETASNVAEGAGAPQLTTEGAAAGAVSGAAVGTVVGLALAGSTLVLPGMGPLLIGGPIAAGLTGAGVGATSGGLLGALVGAGVPEGDAEHYAALVDRGEILVSVDVTDDQALTVQRVFDEEGARRIRTG